MLKVLAAILLLSLPTFAGTIIGQIQTPTGGVIVNGTLTFILSQPGIIPNGGGGGGSGGGGTGNPFPFLTVINGGLVTGFSDNQISQTWVIDSSIGSAQFNGGLTIGGSQPSGVTFTNALPPAPGVNQDTTYFNGDLPYFINHAGTITAFTTGPGGAPSTATYLSIDGSGAGGLTQRRSFVPRRNLICKDGGAGGNFTCDFENIDFTTTFRQDNFCGGDASNSANHSVGELGWINIFTNSGTAARIVGDVNHRCALRLSTGTVSGSAARISGDLNNNLYPLLATTAGWDVAWSSRLNQITNVLMENGFVNIPLLPTQEGFDIKFDSAADTKFTFRACKASVCTTSITNSINADTSFHKFRIRSLVAGTVLYSIDCSISDLTVPAGCETAIATNVSVLDQIFRWKVDNNSTTNNDTMDVSRFMETFTGLAP